MEKRNTIAILSKKFALRIIKLYKYVHDEKHEHIISKQICRSGTSIGANIAESRNAQSKADFINKLCIALKEADETEYWLELLHESGYIDEKQFGSIANDLKTIIGTLINIIKKLRESTEEAKAQKGKQE